MSFKYELIENRVVVRSISKCWTALLYVELVKDLVRLTAMGQDKSVHHLVFRITRQR